MRDIRRQLRRALTLAQEGGAHLPQEQLRVISAILDMPVHSLADLDRYDVTHVVDVLTYWKRRGDLEQRTAACLQ